MSQNFAILRFYFKKSKMHFKHQRKICADYGEGTVDIRNCQKWFAKFLNRNDVPQSNKEAEIENEQIKTLLEKGECYPMREIINILALS